jgi:hypothetical protein
MKINKKTLLILLIFSLFNSLVKAQAKKPIIMVVPSNNWCFENGYTISNHNQGKTVIVPDYSLALAKNFDMKLAIAKINGLMADRGFPLKDLEASLLLMNSNNAEELLSTSKSGSDLTESPIDKLKKVSKADIVMEVSWKINQRGPFKSISFIIRALDAYSSKQIADGIGTGPENAAASVPILLETAILAHIDNFNSKLQSHFDDLFTNGREVIFKIRKWDSFDGDLEKEYNGKELNVIIEKWLSENTINGRFSTLDATENLMNFEQVRIPLFDLNGRATDTRNWSRGLQKLLKETYKIDSKLTMRGLGESTIIIGEK